MFVEDFHSRQSVDSGSALRAALTKRYRNNASSLCLYHDSSRYPSLSIMCVGSKACMYYFPNAEHPGFVSMSAKKPELSGAEGGARPFTC